MEKYSVWLLGDIGVRIRHCRADYPARIIFGSSGTADKILSGIREAGFLPAASEADIPKRSGVGLRWSTIIIMVVLWNGLFLTDFVRSNRFPPLPGTFALVALGLAFALCIAAQRVSLIQRLLLEPKRQIGELRPYLRLTVFITGLMFVFLSIFLLTGIFDLFPEFRFPTSRR